MPKATGSDCQGRCHFCSMPKVVESSLSARPNAIGSGLETKSKSLQHEYECSFGSDLGPQNFEFS